MGRNYRKDSPLDQPNPNQDSARRKRMEPGPWYVNQPPFVKGMDYHLNQGRPQWYREALAREREGQEELIEEQVEYEAGDDGRKELVVGRHIAFPRGHREEKE